MVVKWRRINGRNVQINVDESKIKERLDADKKDSISIKNSLMRNTDKNMTHQERVDWRNHPDRKKERDAQDEHRRRERDAYQNSLGYGSGSAGRVDMHMAQGLSEDDATIQAFEDNGINTSKLRSYMNKPEHERSV